MCIGKKGIEARSGGQDILLISCCSRYNGNRQTVSSLVSNSISLIWKSKKPLTYLMSSETRSKGFLEIAVGTAKSSLQIFGNLGSLEERLRELWRHKRCRLL